MYGITTPPAHFWIFGSGHAGKLAVQRLLKDNPAAQITLIDIRHPEDIPDQVVQIEADANQWLLAKLKPSADVDMIIPAVPLHLAAEWLCSALREHKNLSPFSINEQWLESFPHPMAGKEGLIYTSHADFICPYNCNEPATRCTHTGNARPKDLFLLLGDCSFPETEILVLRSHQLLPGVGGIYPQDLLDGLRQVQNSPKKQLMVATACRCHGVVNFYTQS